MHILVFVLVYGVFFGAIALMWWKKRSWLRRIEQAFMLLMMFVLGPLWLIYGISDIVRWDLNWYTPTDLLAGCFAMFWLYGFIKTKTILPWERKDDKL